MKKLLLLMLALATSALGDNTVRTSSSFLTGTTLTIKTGATLSVQGTADFTGATVTGLNIPASSIAITNGVLKGNNSGGAVAADASDITSFINATVAPLATNVNGLSTLLAAKQNLNDDLTALSSLSGTHTIYYRSGAHTYTPVTIGSGLDFTGATLSATGGAGTGDMSGPASAVADHVVSFNGTTGKLAKDSGLALPASAIVGLTDTQTLTGKSIAASEVNSGTIAQARLGTGSGGTGSKFLSDAQTYVTPVISSITDPIDPTKKMVFDVSGVPTGTTRTTIPASAPTGFTVAPALAALGFYTTGLGLDGIITSAPFVIRQTFSNANVTINSATTLTEQTGTMTLPRVATLPAANSFVAGALTKLADGSGTVSATNKLSSIAKAGDTLAGASDIIQPFGSELFRSDGVHKWTAEPVSASGTGDASTNTSTSVDGEVVLFSGSGGKTLKRATGTGIAKITSGVLGTAAASDVVAAIDSTIITGKTADTTPDPAADYLLTFDNSATMLKKVKIADLFSQATIVGIKDPTSGFTLSIDVSALTTNRTMVVQDTNVVPITPTVTTDNKTVLGITPAGAVSYGYPIVSTPTAIAANTNNYTPSALGYNQRWTSAASYSITGLYTLQTSGAGFLITNANATGSGFNFTLVNESGSSTATNRFHTVSGSDIILFPDEEARVWYDSTLARWRVEPNKITRHSVGFTAPHGSVATGKVGGYITVPYSGKITGWNISVDTGTCTVKTWKKGDGTSVPDISHLISTSGVSISTGTHIHSSNVTDFTNTTVTRGDIFAWDITALSGPTEISFNLEITR